jgi:hypothetical protein
VCEHVRDGDKNVEGIVDSNRCSQVLEGAYFRRRSLSGFRALLHGMTLPATMGFDLLGQPAIAYSRQAANDRGPAR